MEEERESTQNGENQVESIENIEKSIHEEVKKEITGETITITDLIEVEAQFGYVKRLRNPLMNEYIYDYHNKISIINLDKTLECIQKACNFLESIASKGGKILFICTKERLKDIIEKEAKRCGASYMCNRYLPGFLTNFQTFSRLIQKEASIQKFLANGARRVTKKEALKIKRKWEKIQKNLNGVKNLSDFPKTIVIIDPVKEKVALKEALTTNTSTVILTDTNGDPFKTNFPVPINCESVKSISLVMSCLSNAISAGSKKNLRPARTDFKNWADKGPKGEGFFKKRGDDSFKREGVFKKPFIKQNSFGKNFERKPEGSEGTNPNAEGTENRRFTPRPMGQHTQRGPRFHGTENVNSGIGTEAKKFPNKPINHRFQRYGTPRQNQDAPRNPFVKKPEATNEVTENPVKE